MDKTYLVFVIQGYEVKTPDGALMDMCTIELIDTNYESALKRAKKIIKKSAYRLSTVIENYRNDKH